MYRFIRHGAVLSNEFFSESTMRLDWTTAQLRCYLAFKGVDYVVVEKAYLRQYHRNEEAVLQSLVAKGLVRVTYVDPAGKFTVYDVRAFAAEQEKPASLGVCGIY